MALVLLTPPTAEAVTLAELKAHLRVDGDYDDASLGAYLKAAIATLDGAEGKLGRCLIEQEWQLFYDVFPRGPIRIPLGPLRSVSKVEYIDPTSGAYVEFASSNYVVDTASYPGWISPVSTWPSPKVTINAVRITFKAGHGTAAADVPPPLRAAILLHAGNLYMNRESVVDPAMAPLPHGYDDLIRDYRGFNFGA